MNKVLAGLFICLFVVALFLFSFQGIFNFIMVQKITEIHVKHSEKIRWMESEILKINEDHYAPKQIQ